nr:DUF4175 family protein [Saprospiraceae bacterium]
MKFEKSNYHQLISKLDEFIRKYYINNIIRGTLYSAALLFGVFITFILLEHFFYFGTGMRKFLFFSFIGIAGISIAGWIVIPLMKYFSLGKVISREEAAGIIGTHFSEVQDKLLNILQLKQQAEKGSSELVMASIEQKTVALQPIPFKSAIDLGKNKKYLKYVALPLILIIGLLVAAPSLIQNSTERLVQNHLHFERPAPFHFKVLNDDLSVLQFENLEIEVTSEGDVKPSQVFIQLDGVEYRMKKNEEGNFTYRINNIQSATSFRLQSGPVRSRIYEVEVIQKPRLTDMIIDLDFPSYTGRSKSTLTNIGDITVPQGTRVNFTFYTEATDAIELEFESGDQAEVEMKRPQHFEYSRRVMKSKSYKLYVSGTQMPRVDSVGYTINVIPDRYPIISVEEFIDEDDDKIRFFAGEATDDYGLREISFHYQIKKANGSEMAPEKVLIENPGSKEASFVFNWDIQLLDLKAGDEVTYYFQSADNDAINGSKKTRTGLMTYRIMSVEEMSEIAQENTESIRENLSESLTETELLQEEIKKMQDKLLNKEDLDWQDKRDLEQLLNKKEELQKMLDEAREKMSENLRNEEEHMDMDPELAEKQKRFEELFNQMMDEETQSLMDQIRDMLDELTKEEAMDMLKDMELSEQNMQMNIDRMNELFKSLQVEKQMADARKKLEELAEKLEELSEESAASDGSEQEELLEKQEDISEQFEQLQEKLEELRENNEQLARPHKLGDQEKMEEEIANELNEAGDQLEDGDNQGASESQEQAGEKMKEMAQSMQSSMQGGQMEQMQEDMAALRKLLDNLISISFDQEDLITDLNRTNINTPRYTELMREQFQMNNDFQIVEDSLVALSKRVMQLESFILNKVTDVKRHMSSGLEQLEERRKSQASDDQRRVMTYINDLALMLSEAMEQMQKEMAGMMPGNQTCQNPGEGEGGDGEAPVDKITEGQDKLGEQMEKMGEQQGQGKEGSSEEF